MSQLHQSQGFAQPFAGPPTQQRKMIFQDDDMGTFIGNAQSRNYAQLSAKGQLKSSKYSSNLKGHSSTNTPRDKNKNSSGLGFQHPNIALRRENRASLQSERDYPHQNQTIDPFGVNYNELLKRDQGQDEEYDFTSNIEGKNAQEGNQFNFPNESGISDIGGTKLIESQIPFENIENNGFENYVETEQNYMNDSRDYEDNPNEKIRGSNHYSQGPQPHHQLRQSQGSSHQRDMRNISSGFTGSGGEYLTSNADIDPYNFGMSPQKQNLRFHSKNEDNLNLDQTEGDDLFHKFDDDEDIQQYKNQVMSAQQRNQLSPSKEKKTSFKPGKNFNKNLTSPSRNPSYRQSQNSLYAKKKHGKNRGNQFEILDKINRYNKANKFPSSNMSRAFRKPGFTSMGYSQRALFDKSTKNTYGNVKFGSKKKNSRAGLVPVKGDQAAYEAFGSHHDSKLSSQGGSGLRLSKKKSSSYKGLSTRSRRKTGAGSGSMLSQNSQKSSHHIPFDDEIESNFPSMMPSIAKQATPSSSFRANPRPYQGMKAGDQSVPDEEFKQNHKEQYLQNVVGSLQNELNQLDSELNNLRPSSQPAYGNARFSSGVQPGVKPVHQLSPEEMANEIEENEEDLELQQIAYNLLQKEHNDNVVQLQKLYTKQHKRAAVMAKGDHNSLLNQNYEAFRKNKQLKDELIKLKSNFEYKLKAKEAQVQKVSEQQLNNEVEMLGMRYGNDSDVIKKDINEYIIDLQRRNKELRSDVGSLTESFASSGGTYHEASSNNGGGALGWLRGIGDRIANLAKN